MMNVAKGLERDRHMYVIHRFESSADCAHSLSRGLFNFNCHPWVLPRV